jgi:hypothetical protein
VPRRKFARETVALDSRQIDKSLSRLVAIAPIYLVKAFGDLAGYGPRYVVSRIGLDHNSLPVLRSMADSLRGWSIFIRPPALTMIAGET